MTAKKGQYQRADLDGYAVWRHILKAVEELQRGKARPGERTH